VTVDGDRNARTRERDRIGDERDGIADERDQIADERDAIADEREVAWIRWEATCHAITTAADLRDHRADKRDAEAQGRDVAAKPDEYLSSGDTDQASEVRAAARMDRRHAKSNRIASSVDRFQLTFFTPGSAERRAAAKRRIAAVARAEADAARRNPTLTQQPKRSSAIDK
jgi:hypothetical protein